MVNVILHRLRLVILYDDREVERGKLLVQTVNHSDRTVRKLDQVGLRVSKQGNGNGIFAIDRL